MNILVNKNITVISVFISLTSASHAKESDTPPNLNDMSIEQLMNVQIEGATREKHTLSKVPASVTVINHEEILHSGARNLTDLLNLVPGILIAADTQGVISIGIRGLWAHEGKVLLLVDGEELNDLTYNTIQLGNNFPVDSIQRLEVIRGPGSAAYGGYAELGIINIITRDANEINGLTINGLYGQMAGTYAERNFGAEFGKQYGNWKTTSSFLIGQGHQSNRDYTDNQGSQYNYSDRSQSNPTYVNIGATNKQLSFRLIYSRFNTTDQSAYGTNAPIPVNNNFETLLVGAKHEVDVSDSTRLTSELHFKQNCPWNSTNPESHSVSGLYYDVKAQEVRAGVSFRSQITPELVSHYGVEERILSAVESAPNKLFQNGSDTIHLYKAAAFGEINWTPKIADFSLGGRYDQQNTGASKIVPRLTAVKELGDFYIKLIYGWGFRQPGIENLRYNPALKPETTRMAETELGYKLADSMLFNLNAYSISLDNPIIYGYSSNSETYQNSNDAGSFGLEANYRAQSRWGSLNLNYSYFHTTANEPVDYQVPGHADSLLGMANHKATVNLNLPLGIESLYLNFSEIFLSARYGYDYDANSASGLSLRSFNPTFLTQLYLEKQNFLIQGLSTGLGVFNLLNQDFRYVQPYDGGHPPIPAQGRDWVIKASYQVRL